ncbi:MAG TPA: glycosyl transferase, partial [Lachnospiraceae bacterium]|nr:glycosyl transferase [Lachnospiraceae bacterium]
MNYGERQINKKIKKLASSRSKILNRVYLYSIIFLVILLISAFFVILSCFAGALHGLIDSAPVLAETELMPSGYATTIYDTDGNVTQTLAGSDANRIYMDISKIPLCVQHAFVAIEDARFYEHKGIDLKAIVRAVYSSVISNGSIEQGASTITQQLLKNQVFGGGNETSIFAKLTRKIQEQCLA